MKFKCFYFLLFIVKAINPEPNKIAPETKGNPAPTKSSSSTDYRKGKENIIPNRPVTIVNKLIISIIDLIFFVSLVLIFDFY